MALFGAPVAHEDHALRACYAALAMQEDMRRYSTTALGSHQIRIGLGLNSGELWFALSLRETGEKFAAVR
jgi:class 3 adenylate cyclase